MSANTTTTMFLNHDARANNIVARLIARIRQSGGRRSFRGARLNDATLSDLGITRELAEFGLR